MIGITTKWKDRNYRIPADIILSLNQNVLTLQSEYISLWKIAEVGTEFKFTISHFNKPTGLVSKNPHLTYVDLEYQKLVEDESWQLQMRLEEFRRLEAILKSEGVI
ncbi:hypothetical protein [Sphingobacterium siyangense]|uniref:hypothetical protein n=1 Tax=Sphingobacterium siyangense TaxID=459529 RepID=UPI002FDB5506